MNTCLRVRLFRNVQKRTDRAEARNSAGGNSRRPLWFRLSPVGQGIKS
jgi:hypothetical protein